MPARHEPGFFTRVSRSIVGRGTFGRGVWLPRPAPTEHGGDISASHVDAGVVYGLDHIHESSATELRHLLAGKGAGPRRMRQNLRLPAPTGVVPTTQHC